MPTTTFLRLLAADDKAAALAAATDALRAGQPAPDAYAVDPASFRQVPGAPFAYWVTNTFRSMYVRFPSIGRTPQIDVERGGSTMDDTRYLRLWWEVIAGSSARSREATLQGKQWVTFVKGGAYSQYYTDWELVVDWLGDGEVLKREISQYRARHGWGDQWTAALNGHSYYFRSGLTWPRRTVAGLNVRIMPAGCIFADKGPTIFLDADPASPRMALLALLNSAAFRVLLALQVPSSSFEVGFMHRMPLPYRVIEDDFLAALSREAHDLKRDRDCDDEVTHPFTCPALVRLRDHATLAQASAALAAEDQALQQRLAAIQREIDDRAFDLYGFTAEDRAQVERGEEAAATEGNEDENGADDEEDVEQEAESAVTGQQGLRSACADLLMYAVGCAFGRWDARIGRDPSLAPALADPFAPLPVCAPGALVGPGGLPATRDRIVGEEWLRARPDAITLPPEGSVAHPTIADEEYPLTVAWDGLLPDDPDHPADLVRRVREVLELFWGERAEAIEREACGILGVRDLRDWFRSPRGFFDHHISRYSKSRRKAPIYWLLQSSGKQYGLWLYYHRLDTDLVFKALTLYLQPKLRREETRLEELRAARQAAGTSGPEARRAAQAVERQEALLADLREFHDRLDRAARLYLTPDLNDGVVLTIAPLHELVPWREARSYWEQLVAGKYEWSSIGKQMREKGVVGTK